MFNYFALKRVLRHTQLRILISTKRGAVHAAKFANWWSVALSHQVCVPVWYAWSWLLISSCDRLLSNSPEMPAFLTMLQAFLTLIPSFTWSKNSPVLPIQAFNLCVTQFSRHCLLHLIDSYESTSVLYVFLVIVGYYFTEPSKRCKGWF